MNIKKYPNRKFYANGQYLGLRDIEKAVISGNKVKVYDHTGKILARIFEISTPDYIKTYLSLIGL